MDIELKEMIKTVLYSASAKRFVIKAEDVEQPLVEALLVYEWLIAIWPDASMPNGIEAMEIINTQKESGFMRCNSIPCTDKQVALKIKQLCDQARGV